MDLKSAIEMRILQKMGERKLQELQNPKKFNITFHVILTSLLSSAVQITKIISNTFKMKIKIVNSDELVSEGIKLKWYDRLNQFTSESSVFIVDHEPYPTNIIRWNFNCS
jgi:phosphohistidine phosphatase SixA